MAAETARRALETAASAASSWRRVFRDGPSAASGWTLAAVALVAVILFTADRWRRRPRVSEATRAYLALRRLLGRRLGFLSPAIAPADVARLVAEAAPERREDAEAVVRIYCADAFGGIEPDLTTVRDLQERVRRLKKLA
jgi:hypothetical protein